MDHTDQTPQKTPPGRPEVMASTGPGRLGRSRRHGGGSVAANWVTGVGVAGTVLIAMGAFVLSFTALTDLAESAGIRSDLTWIWPLIVDGLIVVATIGVVALAGREDAWYPWVLLVAASVVSIAANAVHATFHATSVPALMAALIAAVPPLVLMAVTHLSVVLNRKPAPTTAAVPYTAIPDSAPVLDKTAMPCQEKPRRSTQVMSDAMKRKRDAAGAEVSAARQAREFVVGFLRSQGGSASVKMVTQAGGAAGFSADALRVARRRCQPSVVSTDAPEGRVWAIQDDPQPVLACV